MDPLSALSLAAIVCQFVEYAGKIVSKGNKLRNSPDGLFVEDADLQAASRTMIHLNDRLITAAKTHSQAVGFLSMPASDEIQRACVALNQTARELIETLEELRLPSRAGRWRSMRQAVKAVAKKNGVEKMKNDLAVQRQRLDTALLSSLWSKMNDFASVNRFTSPFTPETEEQTIRHLFSGGDPPVWQANLAHKILQNGWNTTKKGHIEQFSTEVYHRAAKQTSVELQQRIIRQLHFEDLPEREYKINAAHKDTFHWVYDGPSNLHQSKWCLFTKWMESSERIYWITGKPGSGKSTLMKFLRCDSRTREHLSAWSGDLPLVTAHFYFWNSGSQVQNSLEGFYRTVIYTLLFARMSFTPEAFPDRWANAKLFGEDRRDWSMRELEQAFALLINRSGTAYKLCLFIDGLDEYEGNQRAFLDQLSDLTAAHDTKLCVASRPWPVFEDAFSTGAHLMLQDLTLPDIVRFTWSKLHSHRGFKILLGMEEDYAGDLIIKIAQKSQGVFLWVDLVTESLLEGLAHADRVADLERRLEELPGDLEELYNKMFDSIQPRYRHNASRYLQIAKAAAGQLSALAFYFADEGDGQNVLEAKSVAFTEEKRLAAYQTIKTRLNGACKGFLEIPNPPATAYSPEHGSLEQDAQEIQPIDIDYLNSPLDKEDLEVDSDVSSISAENFDDVEVGENVAATPEPDRKVTYLHRTAKDFLESPNMEQRILGISPPGFDRLVAILKGYLLLLKTLPAHGVDLVALWRAVITFMETAAEVEAVSPDTSLNEYLEDFNRTADAKFRACGFSGDNHHWTATRWISADSGNVREIGFMALAAEFNLKRYIMSKLEVGVPLFTPADSRPILDFVVEDFPTYLSLCEPSITAPKGLALPSLRIIETLLDRGEDPNAQHKDSTTWTRVLDEASKIEKNRMINDDQKKLLLIHWAAIVDAFIAHDADPVPNRNSPVASRTSEIFRRLLPERAKNMEKKLKRTKSRWSSIGKFITPRNKRLDRLTFETTPLPVRLRMESATMAQLGWSEYLTQTPSAARKVPSLLGSSAHHFNRPVEGAVTEKTEQHLERIYGLTDTHPWSQSLVVAIAERMGVSPDFVLVPLDNLSFHQADLLTLSRPGTGSSAYAPKKVRSAPARERSVARDDKETFSLAFQLFSHPMY